MKTKTKFFKVTNQRYEVPTLLLRAFRLKNALQLSQVIAPKLYPKALSPQTAHILGIFVSVQFCDPFVGRIKEELLDVGESHIAEELLSLKALV